MSNNQLGKGLPALDPLLFRRFTSLNYLYHQLLVFLASCAKTKIRRDLHGNQYIRFLPSRMFYGLNALADV